jgi:hypothetical protein
MAVVVEEAVFAQAALVSKADHEVLYLVGRIKFHDVSQDWRSITLRLGTLLNC